MVQVRATAKFVRISPFKVNDTLRLIRGRRVEEAVQLLNFMPKRSAREVGKVLHSAISNAENNLDLKTDSLYVKEALLGKGPSFKRMKPRARGRSDIINRRTCHISLTLESR